MSTPWQRMVERHTAAQETKLGEQVFTWPAGTDADYPCVLMMEDVGEVISEEGNTLKYSGKLRVRLSEFEDANPEKGAFITVNATRRKVVHTQVLKAAGLVWLFLGDANT